MHAILSLRGGVSVLQWWIQELGVCGEGEGGMSQIIDEKRGAQMFILPTPNTLKFIQHQSMPFSSSQAIVNLNVSNPYLVTVW